MCPARPARTRRARRARPHTPWLIPTAATSAGALSLLDILLPRNPKADDAQSLLSAVAQLSPAELVFAFPQLSLWEERKGPFTDIHLPCFHRATSIELDMPRFLVRVPPAGEFPVLERLSVSGGIAEIGTLVTRCPRLRVLRAKFRGLVPKSVALALGSLKAALHSPQAAVSLLLDICISELNYSLLHSATELSPEEFVYKSCASSYGTLEFPSFHRATSIEIVWHGMSFTQMPCSSEFFALERLRLSGCTIVDLGEFISCCPRLRVLRVDGATNDCHIMVHSASPQELFLGTYKECRGIDIATPMLKQLAMEVHAGVHLDVSVFAPFVEKVSWQRSYTRPALVFGCWLLRNLSIQTMPESRHGEGVMPCRAHVLSVDMLCASQDQSSAWIDFAQEIGKLQVTDFSVVDLRLEANGHVYGAALLHLLQALPAHTISKLRKVTLLRLEKSEVAAGASNADM
ncbi:uncharacterized protein [Aegilops tauschii subsp. strangulata]|uniref:uncharacterized protein n=1 Tax=Aegilops tauschii subsp. strangulata TaxID=200361 RepID=UPI003CC85C8C